MNKLLHLLHIIIGVLVGVSIFCVGAYASQNIVEFQKYAADEPCVTVINNEARSESLEKVVLTAGLMTDSRAILDVMQSGQGELRYFIDYAISFCRLIPSYSFKEITDRLL